MKMAPKATIASSVPKKRRRGWRLQWIRQRGKVANRLDYAFAFRFLRQLSRPKPPMPVAKIAI
jgi:hypothetical protein